jgi:hypothetical protein
MDGKFWGILISNGFGDYNRTYLYEYNNHLKKTRVHFNNQNDFMDIDVEDAPPVTIF